MHIKAGHNSFYVYIVTDAERTSFKIGATGDLATRLARLGKPDAGGNDLVYWESYQDAARALVREQEIRSWSRKKRQAFIAHHNPQLRSLNDVIHHGNHALFQELNEDEP